MEILNDFQPLAPRCGWKMKSAMMCPTTPPPQTLGRFPKSGRKREKDKPRAAGPQQAQRTMMDAREGSHLRPSLLGIDERRGSAIPKIWTLAMAIATRKAMSEDERSRKMTMTVTRTGAITSQGASNLHPRVRWRRSPGVRRRTQIPILGPVLHLRIATQRSRNPHDSSQIHGSLSNRRSPKEELAYARRRPWTARFLEVPICIVQYARNAWPWVGPKHRAGAALSLISAKKGDRWIQAGANTTGSG